MKLVNSFPKVGDYAWILDEDKKPAHKLILSFKFDHKGSLMYEITDSIGETVFVPEHLLANNREDLMEK